MGQYRWAAVAEGAVVVVVVAVVVVVVAAMVVAEGAVAEGARRFSPYPIQTTHLFLPRYVPAPVPHTPCSASDSVKSHHLCRAFIVRIYERIRTGCATGTVLHIVVKNIRAGVCRGYPSHL